MTAALNLVGASPNKTKKSGKSGVFTQSGNFVRHKKHQPVADRCANE
jgi:hypothetical protein